MTWYIAGPMSGIPNQNYPAFEHACKVLRDMGMDVRSPHETVNHPDQPDADAWRALLRKDVGTLLECGGIVLLPGWQKSVGARFELQVALTLGLEIKLFFPNPFSARVVTNQGGILVDVTE